MTSLVKHARRAFVWPYPEPAFDQFGYGGAQYFGAATIGAPSPDREPPWAGFPQLVNGPFRSNPIVFACELKRISIFSEARFLYRRFNGGRPGGLFSDGTLDILETPWQRGATVDLLARMLLSADIGGNAFVARTETEPDVLRPLRPDFVTIVMGDRSGIPVKSAAQFDAEIIGFLYNPQDGMTEPEALTVDEVAHWAPIPDPLARFRGMTWLSAALQDIQADQAATGHKLGFFENGATPQLAISFDAGVKEETFRTFVAKMDEKHSGWRNAYKTLYLGGGATPHVLGRDLQQLDFSATQGKGETRIIAAAGLHPVIVPASEGMQGSSLNAGNYAAARRSVGDTTFRPMWRSACAALSPIIKPDNAGFELWYDEQNIPFLREDAGDAAKIEQTKAETITRYVREGFTADSSVAAVEAMDVTLLVHTGLVSVQLQPPGALHPTERLVEATGVPTAQTDVPPPGTVPETEKSPNGKGKVNAANQ